MGVIEYAEHESEGLFRCNCILSEIQELQNEDSLY